MNPSDLKGPFDLIICPGAWTPARHWEGVGRILSQAQGQADLRGISAVQWPGTAPAGLLEHRDAVLAQVAATSGSDSDAPLVLAGHSFGAFPMLEAAAELGERVAGLIFIDAFLPDYGRSIFSQSEGRSGPRIMREQAAQTGGMVPPPDPSIWGLGTATDDGADAPGALPPQPLFPQSLEVFEEPLSDAALQAFNNAPKRAYFSASRNGNNPFKRAFDGLDGRADWFTVQIEGGHLLHVDRPAALAYWCAQFLRLVAGRRF